MKTFYRFAAVSLTLALITPACLSDVAAPEDVGEAASALGCGTRGSCPSGMACDYSDNTCRYACSTTMPCPSDDDNPCTSGAPSCNHGLCYYPNAPDYTVCWGNASDGIHGECLSGSCLIQEWTCIHYPPGTACQGGTCDSYQHCCTGCILSTGSCNQSCGVSGGVTCPSWCM